MDTDVLYMGVFPVEQSDTYLSSTPVTVGQGQGRFKSGEKDGMLILPESMRECSGVAGCHGMGQAGMLASRRVVGRIIGDGVAAGVAGPALAGSIRMHMKLDADPFAVQRPECMRQFDG